MSVILSCVGLLTTVLITYYSFQAGDDVHSLAIRLITAPIFLVSFLFSPLLIKLVVLGAFFMAVPYIGDRLSIYFHRQLKK